jgi:signal transduction histidine kinase
VTALALAVAGASLAAGLLLALILRRAPTLWLQLAGLAVMSVVLPLAAVLLSGWVMFHMGADVEILAVAAGSATAAAGAGLVIARSITRSFQRVRDSAQRLAAGDLAARVTTPGHPAEVAQLATSFNAMAASIEGLFDAKRELVAWASHDLRTPLTSMRAMLEAIEDGLAEPSQYLPTLHEQVRLLSTLVDDLFELARIDAGALTLELRQTRIADLVDSTLRGLEPEAAVLNVGLAADLDHDVVATVAPEKIERVLYNLLTNALQHTPADGSVAVRLERRDLELLVHVEDTGDGLPADTSELVFERFWRADPARPRNGAGLGLAIARGIVEAHGGRIWAENRDGGGARVSFTLPAHELCAATPG